MSDRWKAITSLLSIGFGLLALITDVYVKYKGVFTPGNNGALLVNISLYSAIFALLLSLFVLRTWSGRAGLVFSLVALYLILFAPQYMVP